MSDDAPHVKRLGPLRLDWSVSFADLGAILIAGATIVYTFASLERRVELLEAKQEYTKREVVNTNLAVSQLERDVSVQLREINENVAKLVGREEARRSGK